MDIKELIAKYASNGPRYTSYPTAVHFTESESKDSLIANELDSQGDLSLYIHIPFCASICLFCACSSSLCLDSSKADDYLNLLECELELWKKRGLKRRNLKQIHMGGGTPNFLTVPQILRLNSIIEKYFDKDRDCEFSVEMDPRTLSGEKIKAFVKIGVNRASIGIQDTNDFVQKAINRVQPQSMNIATFKALQDNGIEHINADLIYGLPLQTLDAFKKTLEDVLSLNPTRSALFNYAHVPWMKSAQKALEKYKFPSADEKVECFLSAKDAFESANYQYIGLDHFAKPQDELILARKNGTLQRNFQGYSTHAGLETFGLGLTSISQTKNSYRQNIKDMTHYAKSINDKIIPIERGVVLTEEDSFRRRMIMSIMCDLKLEETQFADNAQHYKNIFDEVFAKLNEMQKDGLLKIENRNLYLSDTGRVFMRNVAMLFDNRTFARHSMTV